MGLVLFNQGDAVKTEIEHVMGKGLVGPCVVQRCCKINVAINQNQQRPLKTTKKLNSNDVL